MIIERPEARLDPDEEEKLPDNVLSSHQVTQKLEQLANQVEIHMEILLQSAGYSDEVKQSFETLPQCIQDLICHKVWQLFGKIEGVHHDFGRHSYLHLPGELNEAYHASHENRIQILCTLLDELRAL